MRLEKAVLAYRAFGYAALAFFMVFMAASGKLSWPVAPLTILSPLL